MRTRSKGMLAESLACDYLTTQGLELVERNFYSKSGEIDLIMRQNQAWVFVEVRHRSARHFHQYGNGAISINAKKKRRLLLTAGFYIQSRNLPESLVRIDVVDVTGELSAPQFNWITNAVTEDGW